MDIMDITIMTELELLKLQEQQYQLLLQSQSNLVAIRNEVAKREVDNMQNKNNNQSDTKS